MTLSDEDRTQIVDEFLDMVFSMSDRDYQQLIWIEGKGPEANDYTETTNLFFEGEHILFEDLDEYHLTDKQIELIRELKKEFEDFRLIENSYWPPYFIDTPEWERVRQCAKRVVEAFDYQHKPFVPVADAEKPSASGDS